VKYVQRLTGEVVEIFANSAVQRQNLGTRRSGLSSRRHRRAQRLLLRRDSLPIFRTEAAPGIEAALYRSERLRSVGRRSPKRRMGHLGDGSTPSPDATTRHRRCAVQIIS
jgi:hypothetical protein